MNKKFKLSAWHIKNIANPVLKVFLDALRDDILGIIDHTAPTFFTTNKGKLKMPIKAAEMENERLAAIEQNIDHYFFCLIEGTDKTKDGRQSIPYNSELFKK